MKVITITDSFSLRAAARRFPHRMQKVMRTRSGVLAAALPLAAALLASACSSLSAASGQTAAASGATIPAIGAENEYADVIQQVAASTCRSRRS
jgi:hypothetical protein